MARSPTADALERFEGQAAFGEAINLLGCAMPHPLGYHFLGHCGAHTLTTAVRFAVHCRRWLELKPEPKNANLICALDFEGEFASGKCAPNLKSALDQIVHGNHILISDVQAILRKGAKGVIDFQKRFYGQKFPAVVMKAETDRNEVMIIPLIVLLDAYFPLLPNRGSPQQAMLSHGVST